MKDLRKRFRLAWHAWNLRPMIMGVTVRGGIEIGAKPFHVKDITVHRIPYRLRKNHPGEAIVRVSDLPVYGVRVAATPVPPVDA